MRKEVKLLKGQQVEINYNTGYSNLNINTMAAKYLGKAVCVSWRKATTATFPHRPTKYECKTACFDDYAYGTILSSSISVQTSFSSVQFILDPADAHNSTECPVKTGTEGAAQQVKVDIFDCRRSASDLTPGNVCGLPKTDVILQKGKLTNID